MIKLVQGFKITGAEAIDVRLILTKAEMLSAKDSILPDVYFALCKDDGKFYIYNKNNEINAQTGKYRIYNPGTVTPENNISSDEDNIIIVTEDGIKVTDNESISNENIQKLFIITNEEDN